MSSSNHSIPSDLPLLFAKDDGQYRPPPPPPIYFDSMQEEEDEKSIRTLSSILSQSKKRKEKPIIVCECTTPHPLANRIVSSNPQLSIIDNVFDTISSTRTLEAYK
jgi:hypothetical protein